MKKSLVKIETENAVGIILAHDITRIIPGKFKGVGFKKGHIVSKEDIPELLKIGKRIMELVSFISIEDDPPDLILSFAIWQPELEDIKSLILLRTPKYEFMLDESERGVKVSDEALLDEEDTMLEEIEFGDDYVRVITNYHQFELDLRKVDNDDIEQAKIFLKKMNFDNRFKIRIVK